MATQSVEHRHGLFGSVVRVVWWTVTIGLMAFAAYVLGNEFLRDDLSHGRSVPRPSGVASVSAPSQVDVQKLLSEALTKHSQAVAATEEKDAQSVAFARGELERYFDGKERQVDALVDELFTLTSKAKMAYYYLKGDGTLEKYLEETTASYLGSPQDLEQKVQNITASLKTDLRKNHNELMLVLETDLARIPHAVQVSGRSSEAVTSDFRTSFDETLKGMLQRIVGVQLGVEAAGLAIDSLVAPFLARALVTAIGSRALLSGGALAAEGAAVGAGASLGPYTLGASIVIGAVIALGIDYACNKVAMADAREKIAASLGHWKQTTVAGFTDGISTGMREFQEARKEASRQAITQEVHRIAGSSQPVQTASYAEKEQSITYATTEGR